MLRFGVHTFWLCPNCVRLSHNRERRSPVVFGETQGRACDRE